MFKEFKKFVLRGNVVDLAVGVVIGSAFGKVVTSLVESLFTPLISAIGGNHNFSDLMYTFRGSEFRYGDFLNALIAFLSIAIVIFFLVVQPLNKLQSLSIGRKDPDEPRDRKCPECLSEIPKAASRCKFCTAKITPVTKS